MPEIQQLNPLLSALIGALATVLVGYFVLRGKLAEVGVLREQKREDGEAKLRGEFMQNLVSRVRALEEAEVARNKDDFDHNRLHFELLQQNKELLQANKDLLQADKARIQLEVTQEEEIIELTVRLDASQKKRTELERELVACQEALRRCDIQRKTLAKMARQDIQEDEFLKALEGNASKP